MARIFCLPRLIISQVTDAPDIRFDGWTLHRASGELTRDGLRQRLPPQPLAMLLELLDRAGSVVTREQLVQVLWPRGVVDFDNSLNAVVRKLRVVLGDDSETPRYIETLPRIGYRFIGKLEAAAAPTLAPPPAPLLESAKPPWISRGPLLMAGMLAVVGVVAWVKWPGEKEPSAPPAAATAQHPRRTTSERAYELYLQGIFNRSRRDINGNTLATANFEAAIEADPHYADAWAGLADTLSGAGMTMQSPVVPTYERAKTAALRAIELDDELGHGHAALAHIAMMFDRDFARAEAEIELARAQDPSYGRVWHTLAMLRAFQNRLPEALDAMRRARELEPTTLLYNSNYGLLLFQARRYDEAIAHAKLLLGSQPRLDQARSLLIRGLVAKGDIEGALEQLPMRMNERPTLSDAGFVYACAGNVANARAEIERIERIGEEGYGVAYDVAIIEAALGNKGAACDALERALGDHSLRLPWMRTEPAMDSLRGEACYTDVEAKLYGD
jgi:DNA-binding winged helix-turn-helix (wHTH) protein/tetratricopeptide (TPR) repeat protein